MIHKTTRSILSVLLAALLLVTSTPLTPAFAGEGAVSLQSESGEGRVLEQADDGTYLIYTAENLKEFAAIVNGTAEGIDQNTSANAKLMNNIVLNEKIEVDGNGAVTNQEKLSEWIPIGNSSNEYRGTFNGAGHTIKGLYIDSNADYQGLFGYLSTDGDNTGTVQNLSVSGSVKGDDYVGGVVGYNDEGRVINCTNTGSVKGSGDRVGGVVGYNGGTVENCYNTGTVTGTDDWVGGVVGVNSSSVTNCYNTGNISGEKYVGGVVGDNSSIEGDNSSNVENCYNIGEVSGSLSPVGGVVGCNYSGTVTGCYFLQQELEISGIGGGSGEATNLTTDEFKNTDNFTNWDFDNTWRISKSLNRPVLQDNAQDGLPPGLGIEASPYEISTADELKNFATAVNGGSEKSAHAKLMNNIDLKDVCGPTLDDGTSWIPIGNSIDNTYEGTFNGDGHTISGLYIDTTDSGADNQGLFGRVNGGTVKDLTVEGSVSSTVANSNDVGGIVGYNSSGTVTNCAFSGSGSVSGSDHVGGVVGYNGGSVTNCYNTGEVSGNRYVGGVVGYNDIGCSVTNSYNTGAVSGGEDVGGVVGYNHSDGSVTNSYNTGKVSGTGNRVGGVVGYSSGGDGGIDFVTGCYFLKTADVNSKLQGIGNDEGTEGATEKDDTAFHSGEVAWRLQDGQTAGSGQVWGQNLMNEPKDNYPQLCAFDADTPQVYKVAFMNDSEEHDAKYANSGMSVTPPEAPNKTDHLFGGWFNNGELTGDPVTGPISVTGNATYTAKWTPFSYTLSATPATLNFGSITEGDALPAAQEVTLTNTGNQRVTLVQPTATNFEITTSDNLTLNAGESVKFTIQPKDKLPRGSYSEQIVVSNTNDEKATITATFTVEEPPYTGKYSYELSTSVGDHGSLTVDRYATEGDTVTIQVTPDQAYKLDDLSVTAGGKEVALTVGGDGTFSFTMPSADVKITATFAKDPDWTEPEEPATDVSDIFLDVAPNAWYKDAVQYAYDNGLMTGVSAHEFAPEATTTRAMIVSMLARLEGVRHSEAVGFNDVAANDWYATAVNWAAASGITSGTGDGNFSPNTAITREQLAAILMNYAQYKGQDVSARATLDTYNDATAISSWANDVMSWAVAEGLLTGVTNDQLQPQGNATRAQVAAILERFLAE